MDNCKRCGSYAINAKSHGRVKGVDLDLCDVCYWRTRAENYSICLREVRECLVALLEDERARD